MNRAELLAPKVNPSTLNRVNMGFIEAFMIVTFVTC